MNHGSVCCKGERWLRLNPDPVEEDEMSARWDEHDVPSLDGKVALVTGANSGLGLATAKILANHGARVLLACRNAQKAEAAAREVSADAPEAGVEIVALDLASLASIAGAAKTVRDRESRLDLLINNAGLMAVDRSKTEDGFETQFGVNHLGHFALTAGLAPLVLATPGSRIVTMASMGHRAGRLQLDDVNFERRYDRWRPYFQSKLANLLFTAELHRRLTEAGADTAALAAHPGGTRTDLGHEGGGITNRLFSPGMPLMQSPAMGALPMLRAATDPAAHSGQYYGPRFLVWGHPVAETPSRRARNAEDARRLWERSEEMTGLTFTIPPAAAR
jgi:NAD(P)-dependent dehydrogenase (short-subunit alcohol dehydrogenase family)